MQIYQTDREKRQSFKHKWNLQKRQWLSIHRNNSKERYFLVLKINFRPCKEKKSKDLI